MAQKFDVTCQRVYQMITRYKESGKYPNNRKTGRKPQSIDEITEALIIEIYRSNNVIKLLMSLDFDEPCNAFWYRLPPEWILNYAQKGLYG